MDVSHWLDTDGFDFVCEASGVDRDRALEVFKDLARYDFPLRHELMRGAISSTIGGAPDKIKAGED